MVATMSWDNFAPGTPKTTVSSASLPIGTLRYDSARGIPSLDQICSVKQQKEHDQDRDRHTDQPEQPVLHFVLLHCYAASEKKHPAGLQAE